MKLLVFLIFQAVNGIDIYPCPTFSSECTCYSLCHTYLIPPLNVIDRKFKPEIECHGHTAESHIPVFYPTRTSSQCVYESILVNNYLDSTINKNIFQSGFDVRGVTFQNCSKLTTIESDTFDNVKSLIYLTFSQTSLHSIPVLPSLSFTLLSLRIENSPVSQLTQKSVLMSGIKELRISGCDVVEMGQTALNSYPNLIVLNLSNNKLNTIRQGTFRDLYQLSQIDLSGNPLTAIESYGFSNLPALLELRFDDKSKLGVILPYAFDKLTNLIALDLHLSDNSRLFPMCFSSLPKLFKLTVFTPKRLNPNIGHMHCIHPSMNFTTANLNLPSLHYVEVIGDSVCMELWRSSATITELFLSGHSDSNHCTTKESRTGNVCLKQLPPYLKVLNLNCLEGVVEFDASKIVNMQILSLSNVYMYNILTHLTLTSLHHVDHVRVCRWTLEMLGNVREIRIETNEDLFPIDALSRLHQLKQLTFNTESGKIWCDCALHWLRKTSSSPFQTNILNLNCINDETQTVDQFLAVAECTETCSHRLNDDSFQCNKSNCTDQILSTGIGTICSAGRNWSTHLTTFHFLTMSMIFHHALYIVL